ncbi:MAG: S8 family peptidase, partial [Planctomycetota bacterium]|nr:S8 family peptidase [Planctomycetota bacterium]
MAKRIQQSSDATQSQLGAGIEPLEPRLLLAQLFSPVDINVERAGAMEDDSGFITAEQNWTPITLEQAISRKDIAAQALNETPVEDGNTYQTSVNLGTLQGTQKIHDYVGRGDRKDIYKLRVNHDTDLRVKLTNLTADAELRLLDHNRELIDWSLKANTADEFIQADLAKGTYYVRVDAFDGKNSTEYDLRVTAIDARQDNGGNTLQEATPLGTLDEQNDIRISGWVGNGDQWDYYQFVAEQFLNLRGLLNRLSANANLHLYDINHNLLGSSTKPGKNVDRIVTDISPGVYIFGVQTFSGNTNYQLVATADPKEPDGRLDYVDFYGTSSRDQDLNAVYAPEAWNAGITGKDIVVAVIDSGVDKNHKDLNSQTWINQNEIPGDGIDNDSNGFVDDAFGWDFSAGDNNPHDENGHGTHVAGIIASARNKFGATGIAYGAKIMAVRVLDKNGDGDFGDLAQGIYYAVDNGANVINLSIGGEYNYSVRAAIAYANANGVFVSVASGNGGQDMPLYPARHSAEISNTLSVGAHNRSDGRAWFSNYVGSSASVQVDGPGVNVYSTLPNNRYGRYSGTSSAAPFVSGLAALVLSVDSNFSPNLVRHFITEGAIRDISGSDSIGGIDAARTLYLAQNYGGDPGGSDFGGPGDGSNPGDGGGGHGEGPGGLNLQKQNFINWSKIASNRNAIEFRSKEPTMIAGLLESQKTTPVISENLLARPGNASLNAQT